MDRQKVQGPVLKPMANPAVGSRFTGPWVVLKSVNVGTWGKRSVLSFIDQGLTSGAGFAINLLLARWMAPNLYGAFAVVFAMYLFLTGFHNVLLLEPLSVIGPVRYFSVLPGYFRGQLEIHAIFVWLLSAIFAVVGLAIWKHSPGNPLNGALAGIAVALPFLLLLWLVRRMCYVVQNPVIAVIGSALNLIFVTSGLFILRRFRLVTPFYVFLLTGMGSVFASFIILRELGLGELGLRDKFPCETSLSWRVLLRDNWLYGRWLVASTILFSVSNQAQTFLVAAFLGLGAAGVLRATQIPMLFMTQVITAAGLLILPNFADSVRRNVLERLHHKVVVVSFGLVAMAMGLAIVLAFFAKPIEFLLFGGKYAAYLRLMPLFAMVPACTGFSLSYSMALRAAQKPNFDLLANLACAPVGIVSAIFFIRWWGLSGAGASMVISATVNSIAVWFLYQRHFGGNLRNAVGNPSSRSSADNRQASSAVTNKSSAEPERQLEVALLTNCVAPYVLPVLRCLTQSVKSLRIFISTPMEADRHWKPSWNGLDVKVQKTITTTHHSLFKQGFSMTSFRHFPYDSLPLLCRYKPDVIISSELGFRTLQAVIYRWTSRRSRLVLWVDASEHTEREIGRARTFIRKVFAGASDAVIVNGSSGAKYVRRLGVPAERIIKVPYVPGSRNFSTLPLCSPERNERRLLYVGQLIERKGLHLLCDALAGWSTRHPSQRGELWFVGDGPLRTCLEQFPMPSGISTQFFGNVEYRELPAFYAKAAILVLPCLADTWGLVVNEALAAGVPVLGSLYSQAVQDLVRDGVNGWTFYPDNPGSFERALDEAFSTPVALLAEMCANARSSVAHLTSRYSADQFVQAVRVAVSQ